MSLFIAFGSLGVGVIFIVLTAAILNARNTFQYFSSAVFGGIVGGGAIIVLSTHPFNDRLFERYTQMAIDAHCEDLYPALADKEELKNYRGRPMLKVDYILLSPDATITCLNRIAGKGNGN